MVTTAELVDVVHARRVASAFLEAPRLSKDVVVLAAYRSLGVQADRWFVRLTGPRAQPVRVVYTRRPVPYTTADELAAQVRDEGVLEIRPVHHDHDRRHPLLDNSIGGTYDRLRAVHDLVSHASCGFGFDRQGEFSGWLVEDQMYTGLARRALATELHAEHSVLWTSGEPAEHKAMLLDAGLLRAARRRERGAADRPVSPRSS